MKKVKFSDVFDDITKKAVKIPTNEYLSNGLYQIIDQGQSDIAGYSNNETGLYTDVPVIVFGDHTRILKYIDKPLFLGADGVKLLKVKDRNFNCKYLFYALCNARIPDTGYNRHFKWLKEVKIPIPSKDEQQKIASVLDKVSDLIALRKQQLAKLDELVKSRFVEMFGDPISNSKRYPTRRLAELGELARGVSKCRPRNLPELLNGPYPLVQTGEVSASDIYIEHYTSTYSELGLAQSKMWPKGTLCITIAANIAQTGILNFDACFPDSIVGFNSGLKSTQLYIHFWFGFFQKILEEQAPQVAQKNINLKILEDLIVMVPPLTIQNDFTLFVEQLEKSKSEIRQSLDELNLLKKSLMQKYFG